MRGLLLFGSTEAAAALRHEIPIAVIDPILFAEAGGRRCVLTTHLETGCELLTRFPYDLTPRP